MANKDKGLNRGGSMGQEGDLANDRLSPIQDHTGGMNRSQPQNRNQNQGQGGLKREPNLEQNQNRNRPESHEVD